MLDRILPFFSTDLFMPHGHCYLWKPELVGLHILSDSLIALAYYSIPLTLSYVVRKRGDLPFTWVFLLFSAFIVACGTTHLLEIWTLWHPTYWLSGSMKLITAVISLTTAIVLMPIVPQALALPSPAQLEAANSALQQEIAERKRIEAELIRSRDLREAIFNESADALFLVDPQTLLTVDCNRRAVELFQAVDKASLIGIMGHILRREQFTRSEQDDIEAEMQSKGFWSREIEYVTQRGNVFWGNLATKPITVAEQVVNLVRVTDITERKQAELAVSRLAAIVESSSDAIISKSLEGTITSWNASAEKLFGYTAAEAIGRSITMLFPPDRAGELSQFLEHIRHGETIESYETVRVRHDGQHIEIAATISPIKDATGRVIGAAKIAHDITARKQTEAALRESESRFQSFMDNSPAAAWITDAAGLMLYRSQTYSRLFQVPNEVIGKTLSELYAPEIAAQFLHNIGQVMETDRPVEAIEVAPHPDGTLGEFLVYKFPIHELSGQCVVGGVAVDVTEREQAKKALRSLNDRLQYLLTNAPVVIFSCKPEGDFAATSISENVRAILGYEPHAFLEDSGFWARHLHPDDRDRIFAHVPQVIATGHYAYEYRFLHGDGNYHWVYAQLQLMRDAVGKPIEMIGYLIDVDKRKQTEEALRQSEATNRAMLSAIPDLLLRVKRDGTCLDFIPPAASVTGVFLPIQQHLSEILPPDLLQHQLQRIEQALATGELQVWEHQLLKGSTLCDEEIRLIPCGTDEVLLIVRDISEQQAALRERKQAEISLRRYERIVSATTDGILLVDRHYVFQVVNQAYANWYNKRQDEILGKSLSDLLPQALFQTEIKPRLDRCLAGEAGRFELWIEYPALGPQFLSITHDPYVELDQTISGVVVSLRDITKLKQAEVALELQSIIVKNMAKGVCIIKVSDGTFIYANPKFEQMFGYDADELIGQHVAIVNYEDKNTNTAAIFEQLARAILEQGEATYEIHNIKKDGTSFWCQATTSVFEHPHYGAVFVAVQQDITDRKQSEAVIQASLREKEVLLKEIHHRVKNNLGVVDGLLQMQSRRSQNAEVIETLKESQNRIASIALVHEKLYGSDDLAEIDFAHYIADLTAHLFDSYNIHASQIKLTTQIDPIPLDIDTAIPCGLIINELVSNALKYAFLNRSTGEIQVTLHQRPDQKLTLSVRDNGIGLPQDFDLKQTKTLGMNLVKGLVKQLQGTLEINSAPGTTVIIIIAQR